jgi:S-layer homology domain
MAASNGEVWITDDSYNENSPVGLIRRYSNNNWTTWTTPDLSIATEISMLNSSQGWAVTENSILQWDGANWTVDYTGRHLTGISGVGNQVWAVGYADSILSHAATSAWTMQQGGPSTDDLWAVSALSTNDAWAVGGYKVFGGNRYNSVILHYTGTWQLVPTVFTSTYFYNVTMLSPTEGYAVGYTYSEGGGSASGVIARWDGTACTQVAAPSTGMRGLQMLSSGEGWAVGAGGAIWRDHNGTWSQVSSPVTSTLYTIAMDSPSHGWAAGTTCCIRSKALIEYDGVNWVDRTSSLPAGAPITRGMALSLGGQGSPPGSEGWIVGWIFSDEDRHPILHLSRGVWSVDPYDGAQILYSAQPEALGEFWAVGVDAHHYIGGSWHRVAAPTHTQLFGLALMPGRGGWAVGQNGDILRYDALAPGQRFYDVPLDHTFYTYIEYLASHGYVSGYSEDNTFRPGNLTTRGQLCKIVVLAKGWEIDTTGGPHFNDVPETHPFYGFIETAFHHGVISGYADHTFRPGNNVTRAQLCKIIVSAMGWAIDTTGGPHFQDVPEAYFLYGSVETAYNHHIISGYTCGTSCLEFRPGNNATRGQICKIVYLAITGVRGQGLGVRGQ